MPEYVSSKEYRELIDEWNRAEQRYQEAKKLAIKRWKLTSEGLELRAMAAKLRERKESVRIDPLKHD